MVHVLNAGTIVGKQIKLTVGSFLAEIYLANAGAHMLYAGLFQKMDVIFSFRVAQLKR